MLAPVTRSLPSLLLTASSFSAVSAAVLDLPIWFKNSYAIVEADIGTPQQKHFLLFDTGSATTWLVDKACADGACDNYSGYPWTGYDQNASSTSSSLGSFASIDYLGGITSGSGVTDVFSLPGAPSFRWNQTFMSANQSSWHFIPSDGFLGLAFSTIADANTTTLVETLMQSGSLDEPRFALYYGKELNDTGDAAGEGILTLGASHEGKYVSDSADLAWVPLQAGQPQLWRADMWSIHGLRYSNKGNSSEVISDQSNFFSGDWAVFDTGAGSITVPPSQIENIYDSIGWNWTAIIGGEHIPLCSEFNSSWGVEFQFGSYREPVSVRLTGDQLARPGFAYRQDACNPPFDSGDYEGLFLFGTPFLNQLYTVFDFGSADAAEYDARIGFGQLKEEFRPVA